MDVNIIGICVTVLLSVIALAVGIFLGLRGFTNRIADKVDETKSSIVLELSGIKENIVRVGTRVDDVWQLASAFMTGKAVGTVEVELKNFGKTKVSAQLAEKETVYIVQPQKGKLVASEISKFSKESEFSRREREMFGSEPHSMNLGNALRITIPSVDHKICTTYMNSLLKWLDTEYVSMLKSGVAKFEEDIKV